MATATLIPSYNTELFCDIYEDATSFGTDYANIALGGITDSTLVNKLYYLLYARYGNSPIIYQDITQFKYKLFSTIFMYGPTWEKRLDIQNTLRNLTEAQLKAGAINVLQNSGTIGNIGSDTYNDLKIASTGEDITNHAYNPSTDPSTQSLEELEYIDQQNVTKYGKDNTTTGSVSKANTQTNNLTNTNTLTKGVLDAYGQLWELLNNDVTNDFLSKFGKLFKQFVRPERRLIFVTEEDEDDE